MDLKNLMIARKLAEGGDSGGGIDTSDATAIVDIHLALKFHMAEVMCLDTHYLDSILLKYIKYYRKKAWFNLM